MADSRERFMQVYDKWMVHKDGPGSEKYWAPELECASRDKLREIQSEKLATAFQYLYDYSPFFHEKYKKAGLTPKDIQDITDLPKIPITVRKELSANQAEHPPYGTWQPIDDIWKKMGWIVFSTTGTTGRPLLVRKTWHTRDVMSWSNAILIWSAGGRPGDIAMSCAPYSHVFAWDQHLGATNIGMPIFTAGPPLPSEFRIRILLENNPTVIIGTPSYMLRLAEALRDRGINPADTSARLLVTGGEPASVLGTKRRIEAAWGGKARIGESAGTTEDAVGIMGACWEQMNQDEHDVMPHFQEHQCIPEVIDPVTMEPVPPGQKGVLLLSIFADVGCLIPRYLVNDYVVMDEGYCECGRTSRRTVGGLQGRSDDMLNIRGIKVHPADLERAVRAVEELDVEYKLILTENRGMTELLIRVECKNGITEQQFAAIGEKLALEVKNRTEVRPSVEVLAYGKMERAEFKAKRLERN